MSYQENSMQRGGYLQQETSDYQVIPSALYPSLAQVGYKETVDPNDPSLQHKAQAGQVQQLLPQPVMRNIAAEKSTEFPAPPTMQNEASQPAKRPQNRKFRVPDVNEETAREALLQEVGQHCCWGTGPAGELKIVDLKSSSAIHYMFETFTEGRTAEWTREPYKGQYIDSPAYGPAPSLWDIKVTPPTMFVDKTKGVEIPHTATVQPCHDCCQRGTQKCGKCSGNGWTQCSSCHGTGRTGEFDCSKCSGGKMKCASCHGKGSIQCTTCHGRAQLKCYNKLVVKWTNHHEEKVLGGSRLPVEKLRQVNGDEAFQEESPMVWPLTSFPDQGLNSASQQLVEKHRKAFPTERILMQRHRVRVVPITEVIYKHEDHQGSYLVYGFENRAYITDYPSTCCGCCVIL